MDLLRPLETEAEQAERRITARYATSMMARAGFKKPRFGSDAYRQYRLKGWITEEEEYADQCMAALRAERTGQQKTASSWLSIGVVTAKAPPPIRWLREPPIPSDQYAPAMATTAARDERLTPQSKALLQVLHARCGASGATETTKGTLANVMGRCERSIQRYIKELVQFGYIVANTRRNKRGLYVGLVLAVTEATKPHWANIRRCGEWLAERFPAHLMPFPTTNEPQVQGFSEETALSPKNQFKFNYIGGHASGVT